MNKPFLKWVGGKARSLEVVLKHLPEGKRLVEPFVGGGAVCLAADYEQYLIADINPDLIEIWKSVLKRPRDFIEDVCNIFEMNPYTDYSRYYDLRTRFNESTNPYERATIFIYLNRTGYNGLCRYNASGGYNVPCARYDTIHIPKAEILAAYEHLVGRVKIVENDYNLILQDVVEGDVVYADPPYIPLNATSDFVNYHTKGFSFADHERLAEYARVLREDGIPMLISNSDCELARKVFHDADEVVVVPIRRSVAADVSSRILLNELLFIYKGKS